MGLTERRVGQLRRGQARYVKWLITQTIVLMVAFSASEDVRAQSLEETDRPYTSGQISLQPVEYMGANLEIAAQASFLHRVSELRSLTEPALTGLNVDVAIWDGGLARASHPDFRKGQILDDIDPNYSKILLDNHATHVAGTVGGSGRGRPEAAGVAPGVSIWSFDFRGDLAEMETLAKDSKVKVRVSNHSYGYQAGWVSLCGEAASNGQKKIRWVWIGDDKSGEDSLFGRYEKTAASLDRFALANPLWTQVVAAGNSRNPILDPHNAKQEMATTDGPEWIAEFDLSFDGTHRHKSCQDSTSKVSHPSNRAKDGGYDTIPGGNAVAKNVVTVGAMVDPADAWDPVRRSFRRERLNEIRTTDFSSWGPTDDGRIKPDVIANGDVLIATAIPKACLQSPGCNRGDLKNKGPDYVKMSGTSMATPVVTGTVALLNELSLRVRGRGLRSDEAKAALIHTALSPQDGPTYKIGWGSIQADEAGLLIAEEVPGDGLRILQLESGKKEVLRLHREDSRSGRITMVWLDPPGSSNSSKALVNDLDMRLLAPLSGGEESERQIILPWKLDPQQPHQIATRGVNSLDNVERIDVPDGSDWPGEWALEIEPASWPSSKTQEVALAIWGFTVLPEQ